MNRLRLLTALVLATLWLPVTQHCGLEAAGMLAAHCAQEDGATGCSADGDCAQDDCGTLESGKYRSDAAPLKVASPQLFICACLVHNTLLAPEPKPNAAPALRDRFDRPRDWVVSWQFERRAAAPAHAPDSLIA